MKVLLIVAMESELNGFLNKLECETNLVLGSKVYCCKVNNVDLFIAKSEVGKVNAATLTTALILKLKPRYVINAGIAGGLNLSINLLDIIASTTLCYHDFDLTAFGLAKGEMDNGVSFFKASNKLLSLVNSEVKKGLIVSGDQFISGIDAMNNIKKDFKKALACDMEGCAIAHVATLLSKKFLVIRCVSDNVFLPSHTKVYEDYKVPAIERVVDETLSLIAKL